MILRLLANDGFLTVNKTVAHEFGLDAAVLLAHLASVQVYWENRDGLKDGMFFDTAEHIHDETTLSRFKQTKAINALKERGVLKTTRMDVPAKMYYSIDEIVLEVILKNKISNNLKTRVKETSKQELKKLENYNKNKEIRLENNKPKDTVGDVMKDVPTDLVDVVEAFVEHRKKLKSPMTGTALKIALTKANKIANGDVNTVRAIFEQSIGNGWKGVFPLNEEKKSQREELAQAWRELEDGIDGTGSL